MRAAQYEKLVRQFYSLERRGMKLDLRGTRSLLNRLGRPQKHFCSVLVGGTNGKGSTCSLISGVLKAAGYNVGLYTSPHVIDFRERIRVGGECIPKEVVYELLSYIVPIAQKEGHSFFEAMTAFAFKYFKERNAELVVAEVGLGGRLDSTNVLDPLVSVITGVAVDHSHILGSTLSQIAAEKAGILRKGRPAVTAASGSGLIKLKEISTSLGAPLLQVGKDIKLRSRLVSRAGTVFSAQADGFYGDLFLSLRGKFQTRNAACAILACLRLKDCGFKLERDAIESGLRDIRWPGRLEEWGWPPLFVFDVAHNPQAAGELSRALRDIYGGRKVILVVGMVGDKDHRGFLRRLLRSVTHIVFTQASNYRALPASQLKDRMPCAFPCWSLRPSVPSALQTAVSLAHNDGLVCITGSFYTVGEAMECLGIGVTERI